MLIWQCIITQQTEKNLDEAQIFARAFWACFETTPDQVLNMNIVFRGKEPRLWGWKLSYHPLTSCKFISADEDINSWATLAIPSAEVLFDELAAFSCIVDHALEGMQWLTMKKVWKYIIIYNAEVNTINKKDVDKKRLDTTTSDEVLLQWPPDNMTLIFLFTVFKSIYLFIYLFIYFYKLRPYINYVSQYTFPLESFIFLQATHFKTVIY
jgi:hypothetical protein